MLSLEKWKKYKDEKKINKEIIKRQKQIEKHRMSIQRKKILELEKFRNDRELVYEKKLARIVKMKQRQLDTFIRVEKGLKPLKEKKQNSTIWKKKAKAQICLFAKLSRANKDGKVRLLDTGERVDWSNAQGGHFYSVSRSPQVQYDLDNIRPISKNGNRIQGENDGFWGEALKKEIGEKKFEGLKAMAKDKFLKNEIKTPQYHKEKYEYRKNKVDELLLEKPYLNK